jgi:hypothetical protein
MPKGGWQFGANGVRAIGADESELRETTALWWANTGEGATGFFYAVGARPERFEATEVVFARILESFRVTEANGEGGGESERGQHRGASGPLAGLEFQRWTDPAERSFSVEVPAGWHMSGGLRRAGTTSKLIEVVAQSPDGQIVRSGDVRIPYQFITPNETLARLGYGEGQLYPGTSTLILSFMPALDFASNYYVRGYVAKICSNIQFTSQRDRPDYIQKLGSQGLLLERNQYTAGEVIYTCELNGKPYVGYLFVETKALPTQGLGDMWNVQRLDGFLAPADRATQADAVLQRMVASFDFDAQWWAAETNGDIQIKEDQRRYREFSAKLQQQTQNERWASWDRRTEQTGDILRGQTRVVDPESGQAYKVEHTSNYYWVDTKHDVIAGTNIPYKPTWDFREMVQTYR